MIYTGDGLRVRICVPTTNYHHWMALASYSSLKRFLPDAAFEIVVHGRSRFLFGWASQLRLKMTRRDATAPAPRFEATEAGVLAVTAECFAVRQWEDDRLRSGSFVSRDGSACLNNGGDCEICDFLCADVRSEAYTPLVTVCNGLGSFVPSEWIHRDACFLTSAGKYRAGCKTPTEAAVLDEWQRTTSLAACLGLNH